MPLLLLIKQIPVSLYLTIFQKVWVNYIINLMVLVKYCSSEYMYTAILIIQMSQV